MPMSTADTLRKGLLAVALLALPVVGCGPGTATDDDTDPPAETDVPTEAPTATQAETTPTQSSATQAPITGFPNGQYLVLGLSIYGLTGDATGPVVQWAAYTWDENNIPPDERAAVNADGDYLGQYIGLIWENYAAYQNDRDPICRYYDSIVATQKAAADLTTVDTGTCTFCSHYAYLDNNYLSETGEGCTEELFEAYTGGSTNWTTHWGYRYAPEDGWPSEFSEISATLEGAGYFGSVYEEFDGTFYAEYAVTNADLGKATVPGMSKAATDKVLSLPRTLPFSSQRRSRK